MSVRTRRVGGAIRVEALRDGAWMHLLSVSVDGRHRTHVHPLHVPGTEASITRFRPVDHPWQYGIFAGLNDVDGVNFWCCGDAVYPPEVRGVMRTVAARVTRRIPEGPTILARSEWSAPDGTPLLDERQAVTAPTRLADDLLGIDVDWEIRPRAPRALVGRYDYGGLSARVTGTPETLRYLSSEGAEGRACHGAAARWLAATQPVDGVGAWRDDDRIHYADATLAFLDHPANLRHPNRWRADDTGLYGPSPQLGGDFELIRTAPLRLRYRLLVFPGPAIAERIDAEYDRWVAAA